jgi:LAO/AO transport system kinase
MSDAQLVAAFRAGKARALARAISAVEGGEPGAATLVRELCERAPAAEVTGFTGPPGAGKSTLVDAVIGALRGRDRSVAVLAVDPSSPFSGGALLGDRIRMRTHALDPRVFVRSMGARGHLGGLAAAARDAIRLLGAFGFDEVLLETVGIGQSELEVASLARTTVLVLMPGQGDGVQMLKAGVMEIADVYAVNKADHAGAQSTVKEIRHFLNLGPRRGWRPPIVKTVAPSGEGVDELMSAIESHRRHLDFDADGVARREQQLRMEVVGLVADWARDHAEGVLREDARLVERLVAEGVPHGAAEAIICRLREGEGR